jgi:hypothetical protein
MHFQFRKIAILKTSSPNSKKDLAIAGIYLELQGGKVLMSKKGQQSSRMGACVAGGREVEGIITIACLFPSLWSHKLTLKKKIKLKKKNLRG